MNKNNFTLNNFNANDFLTKHWQKSPCLIKNALPAPNYITANELAGFALNEEVESRIISNYKTDGNSNNNKNNYWQLLQGPFEDDIFNQLPESHWTLLIQTLDYWMPEVNALLNYFRFIPRWRFDDIMVSYATDAGGVGPHYDNYDVFLIQSQGQRRWRVGDKGDLAKQKILVSGLKHLEKFDNPVIDCIMQPGDILYVPPKTAHWGESVGESIGYSVGYRAPQTKDIFALLANHLESSKNANESNLFFADTYRKTANYNNQIEPELIEWAKKEILKISKNQKLITSLLSNFLSEAKIDSPPLEISNTPFDLLKSQSIKLIDNVNANWYSMNDQTYLNIEGESFSFNQQSEPLIKALLSGTTVNLQNLQANQQGFDFSEILAKLANTGYFLIK